MAASSSAPSGGVYTNKNILLSNFHSSFLADDSIITIIPDFDYNGKIPLLSLQEKGRFRKGGRKSKRNDDLISPLSLSFPSSAGSSSSSSSCSATIGPFQAGIPIEVPLWLGMLFQQRSMGTIVLDSNHTTIVNAEADNNNPTLMDDFTTGSSERSTTTPQEQLVAIIEKEKQDAYNLSKLPSIYYEPIMYRLLSILQKQQHHQGATGFNNDDDNDDGGNHHHSMNNHWDYNTIRLLLEDLIVLRKDKLYQQFIQYTNEQAFQDNLLVSINNSTVTEWNLFLKPIVCNVWNKQMRLATKQKGSNKKSDNYSQSMSTTMSQSQQSSMMTMSQQSTGSTFSQD